MSRQKIVVYVISDMAATLSVENVAVIDSVTELDYKAEDFETTGAYEVVSYQKLHNDRKISLGMAYGYYKHIDGVQHWVLPSIPMGLTVDPESESIKEYSETEYKTQVLPLWDVIPEESEL